MDTKTLRDWEYEKNVIFFDRKKYPADLKLTEKEFDQLCDPDTYTGMPNNWRASELEKTKDWTKVSHDIRLQFLENNNYPVTHENMFDITLSSKSKES